MITEEERIIRRSQGYDIGFERNGKKYWVNSKTWNKEKKDKLFRETGLRTFYEGDKNPVFYDPKYFEYLPSPSITGTYLHYIGIMETQIPQPINMKVAYEMFRGCKHLEHLDLSDWDMSNITSTQNMFSGCSFLKVLNLTGWELKEIHSTYHMFKDCSRLTELNLTNFKINNNFFLGTIFDGCDSLQKKYKIWDGKDLLKAIIEDSNKKSNLNQLNVFQKGW